MGDFFGDSMSMSGFSFSLSMKTSSSPTVVLSPTVAPTVASPWPASVPFTQTPSVSGPKDIAPTSRPAGSPTSSLWAAPTVSPIASPIGSLTFAPVSTVAPVASTVSPTSSRTTGSTTSSPTLAPTIAATAAATPGPTEDDVISDVKSPETVGSRSSDQGPKSSIIATVVVVAVGAAFAVAFLAHRRHAIGRSSNDSLCSDDSEGSGV